MTRQNDQATKENDQEIQKRLAGALKGVIDQQMAEKNPPETLDTFERLKEDGFKKNEVYDLIGMVISQEMAEILNSEQGFHQERFVEALNNLPLPFRQPLKTDQDDD